jgi:hypothetical protein
VLALSKMKSTMSLLFGVAFLFAISAISIPAISKTSDNCGKFVDQCLYRSVLPWTEVLATKIIKIIITANN